MARKKKPHPAQMALLGLALKTALCLQSFNLCATIYEIKTSHPTPFENLCPLCVFY